MSHPIYDGRVRLYPLVEVRDVVDGDTYDVTLSLGFGLTATIRVRLAHVDTPETMGRYAVPEGQKAMDFAIDWFFRHSVGAGPPPRRVMVWTYKGAESAVGIGDGSFGRWLASFVADDGSDLGRELEAAGLVKP